MRTCHETVTTSSHVRLQTHRDSNAPGRIVVKFVWQGRVGESELCITVSDSEASRSEQDRDSEASMCPV